MALNLDKMRAKLNKVTGADRKNNDFWRPEEGENNVRIVPTPDGDPFKDYFFHYNLGKTPGFLCPKKNFGESCPVCDYANSLYNQGTEDAQKAAKGLFARQRFFSPVLVRGEEAEGVRRQVRRPEQREQPRGEAREVRESPTEQRLREPPRRESTTGAPRPRREATS